MLRLTLISHCLHGSKTKKDYRNISTIAYINVPEQLIRLLTNL